MRTAKPITVVVACFEDLLQGGLRELLARDASIETVAAAVEHGRLSVVLAGHRPDVVIVDAGALGRLSEVRELTLRHPQTKLVLLADDPSAAECAQALAFGASACLDTGTQSRDILSAIHLASRGLKLTTQNPAHPVPASSSSMLTAREADVLPLLRDGHSNGQIALALGVGVETVRTHTRSIYRKLGVNSRRELLAPPGQAPVQRPQPVRPPPRRTLTPVARRGHGSRPR